MLAAPLNPPEWPSERALRRTASKQLIYIGLWCLLLVSKVLFDDERDGPWAAIVVGWSVLIALSMVQFVGDIRAVSAWRRFPIEGDEQMVWGTSGQFIMPTGGAGYGGVFGLSTTRLRYAPRWVARLRGVHAQEWPLAALGAVSIQPYEGRRRYGGGRWVVLDVIDQASLVILNPEQHLVAADLHTSLSNIHAKHPAVDPS